MKVVPITRDAARAFVQREHRHNGAFVGWRFGCALEHDGEIRGVAAAGNPARLLDDGYTIEITRCCTLGDDNACSRLYGAVCRAAKALGFRRAVTYTLQSEPGTSLRAAGFVAVAQLDDTRAHRGGRPRYVENLFGEKIRPTEPKTRWERTLA